LPLHFKAYLIVLFDRKVVSLLLDWVESDSKDEIVLFSGFGLCSSMSSSSGNRIQYGTYMTFVSMQGESIVLVITGLGIPVSLYWYTCNVYVPGGYADRSNPKVLLGGSGCFDYLFELKSSA